MKKVFESVVYLVLLAGLLVGGSFGGIALFSEVSKKQAKEVVGGRETVAVQPILSSAAATTTGNIMDVAQYRFVTCSLSADGVTTATVKFAGSVSDSAPNFSTAQSSTNQYDYVDVLDVEDAASIDGDTGISFAGAADHRLVKVNTDGLKWFTAGITTWVTGTTTVACKPFSG
jgi:hypothetical protein